MPVAVKDYLESMKSVSSSVKQQTATQQQSDLKTQQLLSQLIEAISYANSMNFKKKQLNAPAKGVNADGLTTKQVLDMLKAQEKLIDQLAQGQALSKRQSAKLNDAINKFYEAAGAQEINYKKFAASLEKFALQQNLPEPVQTRLINDSRDAHIIGKQQKDKEGLLLPIVKKIRNLLEDSAENTKQFTKKLFVTLDQFREDFLKGLTGMMEELKTGSFLGNLLKNLATFLNGAGMLWMAFKGQFDEGNFKWGQMFKQIDNVRSMFKAFKNLGGFGKGMQASIKSIKGMINGIKALGKSLAKIPKFLSKFGLGKGGALAAKSVSKSLAKSLGKGALKKVPVIGTLMSLWMAKERWGRKDYTGAFIELGSGFAALFPGIGTAISIALDLINLGRDTGFFSKAGDAAKQKLGKMNLKEDLLLSIPVVGPIIGMIKSIKAWKTGDKKGALSLAARSFLSIIPGGAIVGDLLMSLFDLDASDIETIKEDNGTNQSKGFKWPWQKAKGDKGGDGPLGDAPISWQNESGGYSPKGLTSSAKNATTNFNKLIGGGLTITSAYRDPNKMMPLWNSARPIPGSRNRINKYGNEMADPRRSNHAKGLAVDVPKGLFSKLGKNKFTKLAKQAGFSLVYPEYSAVHLEVPKSGEVKEEKNTKALISAKASALEPISEDAQAIAQTPEIPMTYEALMDMFNKFNQDLASGIQGSATPVASTGSATPAGGPSSPSIENITSGTPAAATAGASSVTASKVSNPPKNATSAAPAPVIQPVSAQSNPDTIDTEIKDTDLALLNSLLFQ